MVDVSTKEPTMRTAVASAKVRLSPVLLSELLQGRISKGDVLAVARLSGIQAAKRTPELIPLSHPLAVHFVSIDFSCHEELGIIDILSTVRAFERTGVEMEAMVAVSIAALTVYDMCKGSDKGITIEEVQLLAKDGGKSGSYRRGIQE
jgi:cyclic pyranopterin phosphate synthase